MNTRKEILEPAMKRLALTLSLLLVSCAGGGDDTTAVGTLELTEVDVAPTQPARVVAVRAREGDRVRAGDTLAVLTQAALAGDVAGREARVAAAEAGLRDLQAGARPAEVGSAEAALRSAEAEVVRTQKDLTRMRTLAAAGAVPRQQLDAAVSAATAAASRRDSARDALRLVREGARAGQLQAAGAEVAAARAALQAGRATQGDLTLLAPVAGVVLGRWMEPGEVAGAGSAVLTLGEPRRPWTRVYVNERVLPRLRVGEAVTAVLDGFPDRRFQGRIVSINDRAEYTPRVALTEKERADLVFGVKVEFTDPGGMLKAGLPVTVTFP
ncbi:MAG: efflux RND transporter periplasmic adaptor subunit [Gemmatimonadetes bacterium]|nr:efflux RND transporter periplasmic adaptor subunit [Gemmatimonadota bacterium]